MRRVEALIAICGTLCTCTIAICAGAAPADSGGTWTLLVGATLYAQVPGQPILTDAEIAVDNTGIIRCIGVASAVSTSADPRRRKSCRSAANSPVVVELGAKGVIIPDLIEASTHAGQIEVDAEPASHDGIAARQMNAAQVRAIDGITLDGRVIEAVRHAGVGVLVAHPLGEMLVAGQSVAYSPCGTVVDDTLLKAPVAVHVHLGEEAKRDEPLLGSRSGQLAQLRMLLTSAGRLAQAGTGRKKPSAAEQESLQRLRDDPGMPPLVEVMTGALPLAVHAQRADDISAALRLQKELGFKMFVVGGAEAHLVAGRLKAQEVAVVVAPVRARPYDFATRRSVDDNAVRLLAAGVQIVLSTGDTHNVRNLRWDAGLAVGMGMPWQAALDALTVVPGRLLGLPAEVWSIAEGQPAHFTAFDGDPLSLDGHPRWTACRGQVTARPAQR